MEEDGDGCDECAREKGSGKRRPPRPPGRGADEGAGGAAANRLPNVGGSGGIDRAGLSAFAPARGVERAAMSACVAAGAAGGFGNGLGANGGGGCGGTGSDGGDAGGGNGGSGGQGPGSRGSELLAALRRNMSFKPGANGAGPQQQVVVRSHTHTLIKLGKRAMRQKLGSLPSVSQHLDWLTWLASADAARQVGLQWEAPIVARLITPGAPRGKQPASGAPAEGSGSTAALAETGSNTSLATGERGLFWWDAGRQLVVAAVCLTAGRPQPEQLYRVRTARRCRRSGAARAHPHGQCAHADSLDYRGQPQQCEEL
jgi:hypothetical protein